MSGRFLVIDKPPGVTSHDIVAILRAVTGVKKVGHTGTLDPFATGVLPLAFGRATKLIRFLDEQLKIYDATIALGASTTTGDPEGEVVREAPLPDFSRVAEVLDAFKGPRMQVPPAYSAVKVAGRPLYRYAREGQKVEVPARPIEIFDLQELGRGEDWLRVEIQCTRGTYARVLADEIAEALGSAGHLSALRRLRSGPFMLDRAVTLPELARVVAGTEDWQLAFRDKRPREERLPWRPRAEVMAALEPWTVPLASAFDHLPVAQVDSRGRRIVQSGGRPPPPRGEPEASAWRVTHGSELIAIAERSEQGGAKVTPVA